MIESPNKQYDRGLRLEFLELAEFFAKRGDEGKALEMLDEAKKVEERIKTFDYSKQDSLSLKLSKMMSLMSKTNL